MSDKQKVRKILIVDDEKGVRETIGDYLAEDGFSVETTDTGVKAMEILQQSSFDLIISDLRMPGMDGIALTRNIKAMGIDAPIIVITGFATIEHAVESMKAGAFDFITKPFNFDQIKITVEKALETKRLQKLAKEREFYKKLSNSDELTELANYRYFSETLQKETSRAKRYNRPLSLMMIDIDDFKSCNDTYGHPAGDMVLKRIASLIKKNTRGCDLVARYGGEEFSVILPETSEEEAHVVTERIRESIDKFEFKTEDGKPIGNLSVTIGLSSIPKKANNKKELISTADSALYSGKASGKNCVVVYGGSKQ
jgi:diguanylate cyclase (GGDEF)-like protein